MKNFKKINFFLIICILLANLSVLADVKRSQTTKASQMLSPEDKKRSPEQLAVIAIVTTALLGVITAVLYKIKQLQTSEDSTNQEKWASQEKSAALTPREKQELESGYDTAIIDAKNEAAKQDISAEQVDAMIPSKQDVVDFTISAKKVYVAPKVTQSQISDLVKNINEWSKKYGVPKETYYDSLTQPSLYQKKLIMIV